MKKQNMRKIIKIGSSCLITLPPFWLEAIKLDAGDFVQIKLGKNNNLILKPKRRKSFEK